MKKIYIICIYILLYIFVCIYTEPIFSNEIRLCMISLVKVTV